MKIYLDKNLNPTEKEKAVLIKVIPENGDVPYFISLDKPKKPVKK